MSTLCDIIKCRIPWQGAPCQGILSYFLSNKRFLKGISSYFLSTLPKNTTSNYVGRKGIEPFMRIY